MKGRIQTRITRNYGVRRPIALAPWPSLAQRQTLPLRYAMRADSVRSRSAHIPPKPCAPSFKLSKALAAARSTSTS
jgi:hypothetical protein